MRDSINRAEDLVNYAIELGQEVIAFTEHESVSNAIKIEEIYDKVKETNPNFKIILGNEIYLCRDGLNGENFEKDVDKYFHFILLAKDAIGHQQIREISTKAWMRSYTTGKMRRVPTYYSDLEEIIRSNPGHVIGSTACLGGFLGAIILKETEYPELKATINRWLDKMVNIFGKENFFLEMQPSANNEQKIVNKRIKQLAEEKNLSYIITTDSHYLKKEEATIHKAYLTSQEGDREVDSFYATTYLMGTEELESYMDEEIDCQEAYRNILKIKNMCEDYTLKKPLKIPSLEWKEFPAIVENVKEFFFKKIPMLKTFWNSSFNGDRRLAENIITKIANNKDLQTQEVYDAVEDNLNATWESSNVNKAHWSAYFLNLQKIIEICWNAGTLVGPGRGSGVGFLLLYLLDITQINPLKETTKTFPWRLTLRV